MSADPILDGALADGRTEHQHLMIDRCTISRPGIPTLDRTTSIETPGTATTLYTGACRLKAQRIPRDVEVGEQLQAVARYELALPFDAVPTHPLRRGDVATMTASGDPRLVGQTLSVTAIDYGSTATAWRIAVENLNN